jgi:hypothetical protein
MFQENHQIVIFAEHPIWPLRSLFKTLVPFKPASNVDCQGKQDMEPHNKEKIE